MSVECNADLDHPCDSGDEGAPCPSCRASIEEGMREARRTLHLRPIDPDAYRRDMIDCGRGHLLRPEER
jgi:hypothetical protein